MPKWLDDFFDKCLGMLQRMDLPDMSVARLFLFILIGGLLAVSGILCYAFLGDRGGSMTLIHVNKYIIDVFKLVGFMSVVKVEL